MKVMALYAMRGRGQAVLLTTVFGALSLYLPVFGFVSGAIVSLVTMRRGLAEGLFTIMVSTLITATLWYMTQGNMAIAIAFAVVIWLPVWLLSVILRQTISLAMTMTVAAVLGWVLVALIHMWLDDPAAWWQAQLGGVFEQAIVQSGEMLQQDATTTIEMFARVMTGVVGASFFISLATSLFLARWWQALLYNPGGFSTEFRALRLGRSMVLVAVALLIAAFMMGYGSLPSDMAMVVVALYALPGIALVHDWVSRTGANPAWLVGLYMAMILFAPQLLLLLAVVGFVDAWADLRRWIKPANNDLS